MINYDDPAYAATRLNDTLVRFNGDVVHIIRVMGRDSVIFSRVMDDVQGMCRLDQLDITPVTLGYVNYKGRSFYLTRSPMRRDWRQGLRNINMVTVAGEHLNISYRYIVPTIKGDYPSFKEALENVSKKDWRQNAFSRNFCITNDMGLMYKDKFKVGNVNSDNGGFELNEKYGWVVENLMEDLEKVA